jgi:hypothetical protein
MIFSFSLILTDKVFCNRFNNSEEIMIILSEDSIADCPNHAGLNP